MRSDSESRTFTEEARRRQIVLAAIEVLAESGYRSTSLAAIAARIGVSKGVISYHFAGKDELLQEVVAMVLAEASEYMQPRVQAAQSNLLALRAYVTSNLDFIDTHRQQIRALIEIFNGAAPAHPYAEGHRNAVDALTTLLAKGQRAGEFRRFKPRHVAVALRASIDAVSELLRADPDMDVQAYGRDVADLFQRAVQA